MKFFGMNKHFHEHFWICTEFRDYREYNLQIIILSDSEQNKKKTILNTKFILTALFFPKFKQIFNIRLFFKFFYHSLQRLSFYWFEYFEWIKFVWNVPNLESVIILIVHYFKSSKKNTIVLLISLCIDKSKCMKWIKMYYMCDNHHVLWILFHRKMQTEIKAKPNS